ncbi:uncharacterized protein LOC111607591 [Xiphophorus maculatus]|uniref:Uncharacterized LOC111607591 n=1 Tax=Xiphophorus maculatus TaxID=8083 RepID=M4A2X8_XIPMA|nr:uncharacterized protein LOC111607591 [Xiphophorus maculatus]
MFVSRVFSIVLLVCFVLQCVFAVPMYKKVGGSVVLDSGHKSGPLNSVTWKHQADLALEWFGSEITCYRTFKGRCNLDKTTGSFTITNLILEDGGKYTPEINSVVGGTMELKVIKPVPKPKVSTACNTEKTVCNLTCNANISSEFGPVTYKWKTGDTELSNKEELTLTTKNEEPSFFCVLGNPVSDSASDDFSNPISKGSNIVAAVAVPVVLGILLIVLGVVACVKFRKVPRVRTMRPFKYFSRNQDNVAHGKDEVKEAEEGQCLLRVPQPPVENKSKGKEELNGDVKVNEDVSTEQRQQQQQDPPTEQVSDNQAGPGQISESEETEPTAEEPGKSKDSTCDPPDTEPEQGSSQESNLVPSAESPEPSSQTENKSEGKEELNGEAKVNEDVLTEQQQQQQQDPPTEQVSDNQAGPGQISTSEETEPTAEGPEIVSPPKPRRAVTPGTDSAES